jgi:hypothetical protein
VREARRLTRSPACHAPLARTDALIGQEDTKRLCANPTVVEETRFQARPLLRVCFAHPRAEPGVCAHAGGLPRLSGRTAQRQRGRSARGVTDTRALMTGVFRPVHLPSRADARIAAVVGGEAFAISRPVPFSFCLASRASSGKLAARLRAAARLCRHAPPVAGALLCFLAFAGLCGRRLGVAACSRRRRRGVARWFAVGAPGLHARQRRARRTHDPAKSRP